MAPVVTTGAYERGVAMEPSPVRSASGWPKLALAGLVVVVAVLGLGLIVLAIAEGGSPGERFLRAAPFLAPLLFANMGTVGLIALLDPAEAHADRTTKART